MIYWMVCQYYLIWCYSLPNFITSLNGMDNFSAFSVPLKPIVLKFLALLNVNCNKPIGLSLIGIYLWLYIYIITPFYFNCHFHRTLYYYITKRWYFFLNIKQTRAIHKNIYYNYDSYNRFKYTSLTSFLLLVRLRILRYRPR